MEENKETVENVNVEETENVETQTTNQNEVQAEKTFTQEDVDRIIKMKLPMNISVHTTNPELRVKLTKNPNAGKCLDYLYKMAAAGIELNTQIVLCPGLNDGKELEKTLTQIIFISELLGRASYGKR